MVAAAAKRWISHVPGVRWLHRLFVRSFRRWYWKANLRGEDPSVFERPNLPAQVYSQRLATVVAEGAGTMLEMGCGNARDLLALAGASPRWRYIGVDIQEQAIAAGQAKQAELALGNVELRAGDVLAVVRDDERRIDVFSACASMIYLDEREVKALFRALLEKGVRRWIFCEVTATGAISLRQHIFMHSYSTLVSEALAGCRFSHTQDHFSYTAWEGPGYRGALHTVVVEDAGGA